MFEKWLSSDSDTPIILKEDIAMTQVDGVEGVKRAMASVADLSRNNAEVRLLLPPAPLRVSAVRSRASSAEDTAKKSAPPSGNTKRQREAKIAALKAAIAAGTYHVSAADLADRLMEELMGDQRS